MLGLFTSPRKALVIAHDLLMTAAAVLAAFYIRFEAGGLMEREHELFVFLPAFVVYAGIVYFFFHLYESKWRFASLPDLMNIFRAATVLAVSLLALDYVLVAPNVLGQFFFGKITIVLYWLLQMIFLGAGRIGYRYFRYTRTRHHSRSPESNPTLVLGRAADAEVLLRAIESGAVKKIWPVGILSPSHADRGQAIRGIPVLGDFDALDAVVNDLGQRDKTVTRVIFTPSALEPDAKPEATLMHARRLGLTVVRLPSLDDAGEAPRLAPVNVEDLLLRPTVKIDYARLESFLKGRSIVVTGGGGSIGAEICDRVVTFGASRRADHRELRAGAARSAREPRDQTVAAARSSAGSPTFAIARDCFGSWATLSRTSFSTLPRSSTCRCSNRIGRRGSRPTSLVRSMSPMQRPRLEPRQW